jgi:mandelamide amidase
LNLRLAIFASKKKGMSGTMATPELQNLTVLEAKAALARGEFTALEYVNALLDWQARWTVLNAYTQQNLAAIRDAAQGPGAGRLAGIPIGVKDNIDVAGYATTSGTPGMQKHFPKANAPMIQALLDEGVIVMGKLGMHEMAAGGTCANITFGPIGNPYAPGFVPGGSSGGTGAAVAARLVPAGLGSDTAGSVRAPASLCGCVGFRPTTGRYSRVGLVPGSFRRDAIGWLTRSVADVELLDRCSGVAGNKTAEPVSLRGLRLGVPREFFYDDLEAGVASVIEASLVRLHEAGAELVEVDIPHLKSLLDFVGRYRGANTLKELQVYIDESGGETTPEAILRAVADPTLRGSYERALSGNAPSTDEAEDRDLAALRQAYAAYFRDNGLAAFVIPTTPEPAYPIPENWREGGTGPVSMIRNTNPAAHAGVPALSVPAGLTPSGLPVGIEFDGPVGSDLTVLKIGQAFEAITPALPAPPVPA